MLTRNSKDNILNKLSKKFNESNGFFLSNVIGLPANDVAALRKKIREAGGSLHVAKNTLLAKAAENSESKDLFNNLKGPHAVAFISDEPVGVAKALYDISKDFEVVGLKGGNLEGKSLEAKEIEALAKLPSKDQLLATLLATFNAPVSAFVRVLDQIKEQKENE